MKNLRFLGVIAVMLTVFACSKDDSTLSHREVEQSHLDAKYGSNPLYDPYSKFDSGGLLSPSVKNRNLDPRTLEVKEALLSGVDALKFIGEYGYVLWNHETEMYAQGNFEYSLVYPLYQIGGVSSNGYLLAAKTNDGRVMIRVKDKEEGLEYSSLSQLEKSDIGVTAILELLNFIQIDTQYNTMYLQMIIEDDELVRPRGGCWIVLEWDEPMGNRAPNGLYYYIHDNEHTGWHTIYGTRNPALTGGTIVKSYATRDEAEIALENILLGRNINPQLSISTYFTWIYIHNCDDPDDDFWVNNNNNNHTGGGGNGTGDNSCNASVDWSNRLYDCIGVGSPGNNNTGEETGNDGEELDEGHIPNDPHAIDMQTCNELSILLNCMNGNHITGSNYIITGTSGGAFNGAECPKLFELLVKSNSTATAAELCTSTNDDDHEILSDYIKFITNPSNPNLPIDEYICRRDKLEAFANTYSLYFSESERDDIIKSVSGCGPGFEEEVISTLASQYMLSNSIAQQASQVFLSNYTNDADLLSHRDRLVFEMMINPEYREFVEESFGWSGIMWTIAKELIGDKLIDLLGNAVVGSTKQDILDAIKAAKNGDPFGVIYNAVLVVGKNSPLGKTIKLIEVSAEMTSFINKVSKLWDKIEVYSTAVVEQMWNIVKNYGKEVRVSSDLIGGLLKTIQRGIKTIDEVMLSIPNFPQMSNARMKHILHGDATGGLHHASGLVNDPTKKVVEVLAPNSKGVYKVRYELPDGSTKLSTMWPDSKSEIQVAKTIESIYKDKITNLNNIKIDPITGGKYLEGIDSFNNAPVRIDLFNDNTVSTAYPIFN